MFLKKVNAPVEECPSARAFYFLGLTKILYRGRSTMSVSSKKFTVLFAQFERIIFGVRI